MQVKYFFFVLALASLTANAFPSRVENHQLALALGYHNSSTEVDTLSQSLLYRQPFLSWLSGEFGLRFNESALKFRAMHYKMEPTASPFSWADFSLRLTTTGYHVEDMGWTTLLFRSRFHTQPFSFMQLYLSVGYSERFIQLDAFPIIATFSRDVPDHDFAVSVGGRLILSEQITADGEIATFDAIQVYNLHNPFARFALNYQADPSAWKISAFARYQLLLGFGRLDELYFGGVVELPLGH